MTTSFQPLKSFPNYEISTNEPFIIRSTSTHEQLTPKLNSRNNYLIYELLNSPDETISLSLIRLLATQYIPNPQKYKYVTYLDHNPSNNSLTNIAWIPTPWIRLRTLSTLEIDINPPHQIRSKSTHSLVTVFSSHTNGLPTIKLISKYSAIDHLILSHFQPPPNKSYLVN